MITNNLIDVLPHRYPFKFVDEVFHQDDTRFIANKKTSELNDFFNELNFKSQYYPLSLLIEHAAQTMFLHGYHIGTKESFWNDTYHPVGLLTGIDNAQYYDTQISYNDNLITETTLIKYSKKFLFIKVKVVIKSERTNSIIFTANINGVFLQQEKKINEEKKQFLGTYNKLESKHLNFIERKDKSYVFNSTYWFINGHFPQFPCIPGCFLLQAYIQSLGKEGFVKEIISVKFKNIVTPNQDYKFRTLEVEGNNYVFEIYNVETMEICLYGSLII